MSSEKVDIVIIGSGPVGLMSAFLAKICGLSIKIIDKSKSPLKVGRADALNARTLQYLEIIDLFSEIYPLGKACNSSSVWQDGKFISRESSWWEELKGCFHKHFLMIGQSYIESILDERLAKLGCPVLRSTEVKNIQTQSDHCLTVLESGEVIVSDYIIGSDGSRSLVRSHLNIPFEIVRPKIVWAVVDGVIETDFKKVPEIIVFQAETSDVAWIPREGDIDRFYIRMDVNSFSFDDVLKKINRAMSPHSLKFKEVVWYSQFSVKESVAENFFIDKKVFLAGDSCHIHSVNGGQGLNTGLADAFNLIWKLNMVINEGVSKTILETYESERKPVALSVIESSGELVRSTKFSDSGTHAQDYVKIVKKRAGNITGMGVKYGKKGLVGKRLFDLEVYKGLEKKRLYSFLDYSKFTLLLFGDVKAKFSFPNYVQILTIYDTPKENSYYSLEEVYVKKAILVRPDGYIAQVTSIDKISKMTTNLF